MGFEHAKGDIVTWINGNDYVIPNAYDTMVSEMDNKKADLIYPDAFIQNEDIGERILCKLANRMHNYFYFMVLCRLYSLHSSTKRHVSRCRVPLPDIIVRILFNLFSNFRKLWIFLR